MLDVKMMKGKGICESSAHCAEYKHNWVNSKDRESHPDVISSVSFLNCTEIYLRSVDFLHYILF